MFPKLIQIGDSFFIPTYGVMVALGFLAGLWLATKLARRAGLNTEKVSNLAIYSTMAGFIGAKLMMFIFDWRQYAAEPGQIFTLNTLQAAGVFHGGFLLALGTAWLYIKRAQLPMLLTLDVFAPAVGLGHSIGRLGCFAAGCCWGDVCTRPWAVTFNNPEAMTGVPLGVPLHPTQLYEAGAGFLLTYFLYRLFQNRPKPGTVMGVYLIVFSTARFIIEFFRHHQQPFPFGLGLTNIQWIVMGLALLGFFMLRKTEISREPRRE